MQDWHKAVEVLWVLEAQESEAYRSSVRQVAWRTWGSTTRSPVAVLCSGLMAGLVGS
jgi:hypothetical protein